MMSTTLHSPSTIEPHHGQSTAPVSASAILSVNSPKVSMFGAKAGFVIPKNKLSGSLIPIFRGGGKIDSGSMVKEESTKQVHRKTKWSIDLTQDAIVRKGKVLAYQTRVEQITQHLKTGSPECEGDEGSASSHASSTKEASNPVDSKTHKVEILELERRELIGEILRLNPNYKAPPDYKPLLKEYNIPIPIKSYPGYNFIGLLLGPGSNTQKRLEEETGAKVQVYGTKSGFMEKREITKLDIGEAQDDYEAIYVHVSADTYEKVDAAVALIELLLTPVSGNLGVTPKPVSSPAAINFNIETANQDSSFMMMPLNSVIQSTPRPSVLPIQPCQPLFQPYHGSWLPTKFPPSPSSPFMPPVLPNNPTQFPLLRVPPVVPQYFTHPFNISSVPRTSSPHVIRPQLPTQFHPRQSSSVIISQQLTTLRPPGAMNLHIGPPIRPLVTPSVKFSGWSPAPNAPARPMSQMAPSSNPTIRLPPPAVPSAPTSSDLSQFSVLDNVVRPPANFTPHSTPPIFTRPPNTPPIFSSAPSQIEFVSTPRVTLSSLGSPTLVSLLSPSPRPTLVHIAPCSSVPLLSPMLMPAPTHVQDPPIPVQIQLQPSQPPASMPTFNSPTMMSSPTPIGVSPVTSSKPLRPISGNFTFQSVRTQPPSSPNPPVSHSFKLQNTQQVPFAAPKAPSFRPVLQTSMPVPTVAPATSFPVNARNIKLSPPMLQGYPCVSPAQPVAPAISVGSSSFTCPPQAPNPSASQLTYPANFQQSHQNQHLIHVSRPAGNFTAPNQQLGANPVAMMLGNAQTTVGGNQIYDPFSPTASPAPHQGSNTAKINKPETDAEYEDLMASVGVK